MTDRQCQWFGAAGSLTVAVVTVAVIVWHGRATKEFLLDPRSDEARAATLERTSAQKDYSAGRRDQAEHRLQTIVETYEASDDKDTLDQVAAATMSLGFMSAEKGDFAGARELFAQIDETYDGSGVNDPDFGALNDQAAYQAIVCLQSEGRTGEAVAEYRRYIEERPHSPLIHAAFRRLNKLVPGEAGEHEALLQAATERQQELARIELAKCGPRAIAYLLRSLGDHSVTEEDLVKECGTSEEGTTMANMAKALAARGIENKGMVLNWPDFKEKAVPSIWLLNNHYVLVTKLDKEHITYYDPLFGQLQASKRPEEDDNRFYATVLTLDIEGYRERKAKK